MVKIFPDYNLSKDYKENKNSVLLGLYIKNENSFPEIEWIAEPFRKNSFPALIKLLEKNFDFQSQARREPEENTQGLLYDPMLLFYESNGQLDFHYNSEYMIAKELPIGSGNWVLFKKIDEIITTKPEYDEY